MKIAISGSHCTGKSTLVDTLAVKGVFPNSVLFITEIVRGLVVGGVKVNQFNDHKSQMTILEAHHKNILNYKDFITDRCSLDAFVYSTWNYLNGGCSYREWKEYEEIFLDCINSYDYIFYLPIEFPIVSDGFRDTDVEYQKQIHELFIRLSKMYAINLITLRGSVEERIETMKKFIK
jgi:deoxyadenosine/deoxycytidine kinase